ncbi:hypothetical protein QC762_607777 [Podospora pseudocomata]|uniref:RNase H type-1 domain-containing protein n=1 Tax=Podospora pseudocomata TaxID=2093779 RepID=A0ABR0G8J6_9PEZI|nr:hypothetical protein QC762_607777 [Podospora pseudocomata]
MDAQAATSLENLRNPSKRSRKDFQSDSVRSTIGKIEPLDNPRKSFPFLLWDGKEDEIPTFLPLPSTPVRFANELPQLLARIEDHDADRDKALAYADHVLSLPRDNRDFLRVVYGVDGSAECHSDMNDVYGAFAVCLDKRTKEGDFCGEAQGFFVKRAPSIQWLELMAITEAVHQTVLRLRLSTSHRRGELYIFSDCANVLSFLKREPNSTLREKLILTPVYDYLVALSQELHQRGIGLIIAWIPGHNHHITCHARSDKKSRNLRRQCQKRLHELRDQAATAPKPIAYFAPSKHNSIYGQSCMQETQQLSRTSRMPTLI